MTTSQFGAFQIRHRPEVLILATVWLLIGCSVKPPSVISKRPPENPRQDEAIEGHAMQPQIIEQIAVDTPLPAPLVTATFHLVSDRSARRLLRWHFAVDDIIRYQTSLIEIESLGGHDYRNERTVQFQWIVLDVGTDGIATIQVAVERILLNLERPSLQYDTDVGPPDVGTDPDNTKQQEVEAAQRLLLTNLTMQTTTCGEVTALFGSESITGPWQCLCLTTADFPLLPKEPVGLKDSWCVPLNGSASLPNPSRNMNGRLTREQPVGGRDLRVIECQTSTTRTGDFETLSGYASLVGSSTVGRFDRDCGLYLSQVTSGTYSIKSANGQQMQRGYQAKQQLMPVPSQNLRSLDALMLKMFSGPSEGPLESAGSAPTSSAAVGQEKTPKMRREPVER